MDVSALRERVLASPTRETVRLEAMIDARLKALVVIECKRRRVSVHELARLAWTQFFNLPADVMMQSAVREPPDWRMMPMLASREAGALSDSVDAPREPPAREARRVLDPTVPVLPGPGDRYPVGVRVRLLCRTCGAPFETFSGKHSGAPRRTYCPLHTSYEGRRRFERARPRTCPDCSVTFTLDGEGFARSAGPRTRCAACRVKLFNRMGVTHSGNFARSKQGACGACGNEFNPRPSGHRGRSYAYCPACRAERSPSPQGVPL